MPVLCGSVSELVEDTTKRYLTGCDLKSPRDHGKEEPQRSPLFIQYIRPVSYKISTGSDPQRPWCRKLSCEYQSSQLKHLYLTASHSFGATGHIGGAVLDALLHEYLGENLQVQALVRTQAQADRLTAQYPTVSCTVGRIEDHDIVENLSRNAHIVVNCAPDITHDADIKAILKGLSSRAPEKKGYYIHTSGATLICAYTFHDTQEDVTLPQKHAHVI